MRLFLTALVALPLVTLPPVAGPAVAQTDYPTQPITIVVGFTPGGGMDTLGRLVGARASQELGQQVVVENRPGAGGTIAAAHVANARPDGYTLYLGETAALMGPVVHGDVGYDPLESFVPIGRLAVAPLALVANPAVPVADIEEFIELVAANPGEYFYASPGVATLQHLAVEMLKDAAGLDIDVVQFQGGTPSVTAVVSGEVPFAIVSLNAAVAQAEGGAVTILGVTWGERVPGFPDIPAIAEVVEGFSASPSQFLMAPAGTPDAIVDRLVEAFGAAMADEELQQTLAASGLLPAYQDGATLGAELPEMTRMWSETASSVLLAE